METVISIKNLTRDYKYNSGRLNNKRNTVRAIDDISFDIKKGEVFGLLGPNGAGKSSTIKILTTLLSPTHGKVSILGMDLLKEEKKIRSRINFVFGGERNLYWRLTARENLDYFCRLYKINKTERKLKISYLLKLVGLSEKADERVENFSKGMKQRLQIARGLINDPEILFLDEPTIGLDPIGAKDLQNIIKNLSNNGTTILLTTHYMYEADFLCNRIGIINKGKIVKIDTPENLKKGVETSKKLEVTIREPLSNTNLRKLKQQYEKLIIRQDGKVIEFYIDSDFSEKEVISILECFKGIQIESLASRNSTLEDVYIKLVGE